MTDANRIDEPAEPESNAYRSAGVDIDAQDEALAQIKGLVASTTTPGVLSELGSFGGLFRPDLRGMEEPVLVASADGVGTKLMVARLMGDYGTVGQDLVNHCVNDILVQGAQPLFFLDYVGAGVLEPDAVVDLVRGVTAGCRLNGCALLGGETAEMPGFYQPGDYELVGFVVGLADRSRILDGSRVEPGDKLIGLPSTGLHTNGFSLARKVLFERLGLGVGDPLPGASPALTVGEAMMAVHRSYLPALRTLLADDALHALAHITGGGLTDNIPRILPAGTRAKVDQAALPTLPIFQALQSHGQISDREMLRVFNMGVGMVVVVASDEANRVLADLVERGHEASVIGHVEQGDVGVEYTSSHS